MVFQFSRKYFNEFGRGFAKCVFSRPTKRRRCTFPRDFSINLTQTEKLLKHSPQFDFRADNFVDFKNFKSFLNFNLRLKNVQINFSIHFNFSNLNRTDYCFNCFPYRWMHMNFCEKTKLHRSFDAVYIAILRHVLRQECSEGVAGDEKVLLLRLRGWKRFVYIFSFMEISKLAIPRSAPRENPTTRFSYQRAEARKTLFTRSRSAFPRAAKRFINAKICFGVLRFTTR